MRPTAHALILCTVACLPGQMAHAEIYKWVDENGNVQFGDRPPAEGAEEVEVRDTAQPDPELERRREKQRRLLEVYAEERAEDAEKKRREEEAAAKRAANCEKVSKELREMRQAGFLYEESGDPDNPRVLSDSERAAATARYEQAVRRWCD